MKSTLRFSTIAATIALSAVGVSTAFSATYVPREDNFGLSSSVTASPLMTAAAKADARAMKISDTTQTASNKTVVTMDNKFTRREDIGSAM
jgi:hypothetical protein